MADGKKTVSVVHGGVVVVVPFSVVVTCMVGASAAWWFTGVVETPVMVPAGVFTVILFSVTGCPTKSITAGLSATIGYFQLSI